MSNANSLSNADSQASTAIYEAYKSHNSGLRIHTDTSIQAALYAQYPSHNLTSTTTDLIKYAQAGYATALPVEASHPTLHSLIFEPAARRLTSDSKHAGRLNHVISFGQYDYGWRGHEFRVLLVDGQNSLMGPCDRRCYILSPKAATMTTGNQDQGSKIDIGSESMEALVLEASIWAEESHQEVWIYDQGRWSKDAELYRMVQDASWDDLILDENLKRAIVRDVIGFFDARETYQELSTPWKRGLILHGSPGNGKTSTVKALMKSLLTRPEPVPTLVIKTLAQRSFGPQMSVRQIFKKARQTAPCLVLFEDIDSLVTEQVRSYFFNEVDGLEDNSGILMVGSTNSLENLHPGLSRRPSRFDRKYRFSNPSIDQRLRYCEYWKHKLSSKPAAAIPSTLPQHIASLTAGFSFAYLKEAHVASLLALVRLSDDESEVAVSGRQSAGEDEKLGRFGHLLQQQVTTLREDIGEEGTLE